MEGWWMQLPIMQDFLSTVFPVYGRSMPLSLDNIPRKDSGKFSIVK